MEKLEKTVEEYDSGKAPAKFHSKGSWDNTFGTLLEIAMSIPFEIMDLYIGLEKRMPRLCGCVNKLYELIRGKDEKIFINAGTPKK